MGFLGFFNRNGGNESGAGNSEYDNENPLLTMPKVLTYSDCRNIYKYWALGKRIARALPVFALSAPRKIVFENMPSACMDYFLDIERKMQINKLLKEALTNIRIFGVSGICFVCENKDLNEPISYEDTIKNLCAFNIIDPLNLAGSEIGTEPTSINYQRVSRVKINGKDAHLSRCFIGFNDHLFYLDYVPSNFNFGSGSIYQNMTNLIQDWERCVIALERISTKAGSILVKNRDGGVLNSVAVESAKRTLNAIREMRNDGIASLNHADSVEMFSLSGAAEVDAIVERMNHCIMMALSDTPSAILLDERLAKGFGDGGEDMKAIIMAVNEYRESQIRPIYNFIDKFLLYLAFTPEVLESLKKEYKEFENLNIVDLRELIFSSFRFEWGNLYPESEATRTDNMARKLDNLIKLRDLGANAADIENIINADDTLFLEEIRLDNLNFEKGLEFGDELMGDTPTPTKDEV